MLLATNSSHADNLQETLNGLQPSKQHSASVLPMYPFTRLQNLLEGPRNSIHTIPLIQIDSSHHRRQVPCVTINSPWGGVVSKELPEYVHFWKDGWEHLLSGREPDVGVPVLEKPVWQNKKNELWLDVTFQDSIVLHYRVIPHNAWVETQWGITNNTNQPLINVWFQCCSSLRSCNGFDAHSPATSHIVVDGKLKNWLEIEHVGAMPSVTSDWNTNLWLSLFLKNNPEKCEQERQQYMLDAQNHASRRVAKCLGDMPFIMKTSEIDSSCHIFLFSSPCRTVFYNPTTPCMHSDPMLGDILPGQTQWATEYTCFYRGNLKNIKESLCIK